MGHYEHEVKRSRFIAKIKHIESVKEARCWFAQIRTQHPDARHICWAYIAGNPSNSEQAMSDDGEPSGTAGKPILNVLQHSGAGEIASVVIRYFGGIKLGAGGLVRAYSTATSEALKHTSLTLKLSFKKISLSLSFAEESTVRHLIEQSQGKICTVDYCEQVHIICQLPEPEINTFLHALPHLVTCKEERH